MTPTRTRNHHPYSGRTPTYTGITVTTPSTTPAYKPTHVEDDSYTGVLGKQTITVSNMNPGNPLAESAGWLLSLLTKTWLALVTISTFFIWRSRFK
jgi:hypothetical protein